LILQAAKCDTIIFLIDRTHETERSRLSLPTPRNK
jgi:hypothetical protein